MSAVAAAPVYLVEKMMRKDTAESSKPPGMRKEVVTASAISFTVSPAAARPPGQGQGQTPHGLDRRICSILCRLLVSGAFTPQCFSCVKAFSQVNEMVLLGGAGGVDCDGGRSTHRASRRTGFCLRPCGDYLFILMFKMRAHVPDRVLTHLHAV